VTVTILVTAVLDLTFGTVLIPVLTNNPKPASTGTCEAGVRISINITTGVTNTTEQTIPAFTCLNSIYSVIPTISLPSSPYCATANIVDLASNTAIASGCSLIDLSTFVIVTIPQSTSESKLEIVGTCTSSTIGDYQVPVVVVIKVPSGASGISGSASFDVVNETVTTVCTTTSTYRLRPNVAIVPGPFQVTATATDAIGNQAIASAIGTVTQILSTQSSDTIVITSPLPPQPEVIDFISDPYQCGPAIPVVVQEVQVTPESRVRVRTVSYWWWCLSWQLYLAATVTGNLERVTRAWVRCLGGKI
jgi:hypothetical protein